MKILMIAPTPFFADRGCHTRIYGEITALQKRGHEIILCTYGLGRDVKGVTCKRCFNFPWYNKLSAGPSITKIFLLPFLFATSLRQLRIFKPDVVHLFLHEGAIIGRLCRVFYKHPQYFHDMQGSLSIEAEDHGFVKKGGFIDRFFITFEKRINRWFPIITQSENLHARMIDSGVPPQDIVNTLDGVDVELFKPQAPSALLAERFSIDLRKPRVLFLGVLKEYQGVDLMLKSLKIVHQLRPDAQFIIIGFPNIEKYKEQCRSLGILNNTIFIGRVLYQEVPHYLSLADITVSPKISAAEGSGKIYSYMAMGIPTVAADTSVSREILGNDTNPPCGLLADMENPAVMAEMILQLMADPVLRSNIGKAARQRAVQYLSYDISAHKIETFYNRYLCSNQH